MPRTSPKVTTGTPLSNPHARSVLRAYLAERCGIPKDGSDRALTHCTNSFFGIFATLEGRLKISIPEDVAANVVAKINKASDGAESKL